MRLLGSSWLSLVASTLAARLVTREDTPGFVLTVHADKNNGFRNVEDVQQVTGYLNSQSDPKNNMHYWFFESRNDPANDPLIIWFTGGPGYSSIDGVFYGGGPFRYGADRTIRRNKWAWNANANVVFIDQTFIAAQHGSETIGTTNMYAFIRLLYKTFPQLRKVPLHLASESWASHFMPTLAAYLLTGVEETISVASVMMSGAFVDPYHQIQALSAKACGGLGTPQLLDGQACSKMQREMPKCLEQVQECYKNFSSPACIDGGEFCRASQVQPLVDNNVNLFDVRKVCQSSTRGLCDQELDHIDGLLSQAQLRAFISSDIKSDLKALRPKAGDYSFWATEDWLQPYHLILQYLLDNGIPVLMYSGENDLIGNWDGMQFMLNNLKWEGADGYQREPIRDYKTDRGTVGRIKAFGPLNSVNIYDAGHFVARDQAETVYKLVQEWLSVNKRTSHITNTQGNKHKPVKLLNDMMEKNHRPVQLLPTSAREVQPTPLASPEVKFVYVTVDAPQVEHVPQYVQPAPTITRTVYNQPTPEVQTITRYIGNNPTPQVETITRYVQQPAPTPYVVVPKPAYVPRPRLPVYRPPPPPPVYRPPPPPPVYRPPPPSPPPLEPIEGDCFRGAREEIRKGLRTLGNGARQAFKVFNTAGKAITSGSTRIVSDVNQGLDLAGNYINDGANDMISEAGKIANEVLNVDLGENKGDIC